MGGATAVEKTMPRFSSCSFDDLLRLAWMMMVLLMPSGSRSGNFLTRILSISSLEAPSSRLIISMMIEITPGPLGLAAPVLLLADFLAMTRASAASSAFLVVFLALAI